LEAKSRANDVSTGRSWKSLQDRGLDAPFGRKIVMKKKREARGGMYPSAVYAETAKEPDAEPSEV